MLLEAHIEADSALAQESPDGEEKKGQEARGSIAMGREDATTTQGGQTCIYIDERKEDISVLLQRL